jgi:predicted nucleic acid-binding protein
MAEVLIDTSAWIAFFRGHEPLASRVDAALADGSAAVCGMIELEVLQNVRPGEEDVRSLMRSTLRLRTDEADYREAGERLAGLRRRGVTLPVTDGLIAQVALRYQVPLLEFDKHFDHIEGLVRIPWRAS